MTTLPELQTLLETAESAARAAGELAREKWTQPRQTSSKGFRDLVTDADVACQKLITDMIRTRFPDHGFLTEEADANLPTSGPILWVIDPIDGTTNYSRQNPVFCVSVAAVVPVLSIQYSVSSTQSSAFSIQHSAFEVLVGAIYDPMRDELFSAAQGQGAWLNQRPIHTSSVEELQDVIVALDWSHQPEKRQRTQEIVGRLMHHVFTIRAIGSAAMAITWVAAGRLDGYFNLNVNPWDFAAASLILQEAGGQLTNLQGGPMTWDVKGNECVASNGRIHTQFLQLMAR